MGDKEKKTVTIFVNSRPHEVEKDEITFEEVIILAFGTYEDNPLISYSVGYSKGHGGKVGTLEKEGSVKVKDEMVFDVDKTDKS